MKTEITIKVAGNCPLEILKSLHQKGFNIFRANSLSSGLYSYNLDSPDELRQSEYFYLVYNGNKYFDTIIGEGTIPKSVEHIVKIRTISTPK